jgi:hypothetical protein
MARHLDPGVRVFELGPTLEAPWLMVCPRCEGCARLVGSRLVCSSCALDRTSAARDYGFWLSTRCCGEELFATSERHLGLLEDFVLASLRERRRDPEKGWSNQSMESRLPGWMKAGKNRDELARGLARLRKRLEQT